MSNGPEAAGGAPSRPADAAPGRNGNPRVRIGLLIAGVALLAVGVLYGIHWFLYGRYIVSTDDAYLRADLVTVAPRISGYIDEIYVNDNQAVAAGQPLLRIDARNYQDALSQQTAAVDARQADLAAASNQVLQQQAAIAQDRAQLTGAQANAQFAQAQAQRYRKLRDQGVETDERYAQADNERQQNAATELSAAAALRVAQRQLATLQSQVEQARAQLESAQASVSTARLNLDDTLLRASIAGVVGDDTARVGQYVQPGTRLMSVVPVQGVYLVGNFKETQLQQMRIGQPATVKVDALGGVEIRARVESFAPGTGAQFALLPPENATGNFIKIVQRVPVRLALMPDKDVAPRLLPGLSATVSVDTAQSGANASGPVKRQGAAGRAASP